MTRCICYLRVSSEHQRDNHSLPTQREGCLRFAAERGWEVVDVIEEVRAAKDFERPRLAEVRNRVATGEARIVLVYDQDRLSRKQRHTSRLIDELDEAGAEVWSVRQGKFETDALGTFMVGARAFGAETELEQKRERAMRGQKARIEGGRLLGGHQPLYGYRFPDDERRPDGRLLRARYEIDPATAPVVRRIFRDYAGGKGLRQIAVALNAEGVAAPGGRHRGEHRRWSHRAVQVILEHRSYKGKAWGWCWRSEAGKRNRHYDAENAIRLPDGTVPAIVSVEEWEAAQAARERNRRHNVGNTADPEALLLRGGFARCGACGGGMRVRRDRDGYYYACNRASDLVSRCVPSPTIKAAKLDAAAWGAVRSVLLRPDVIRREIERLRENDPTVEELAAVERRLADLLRRRRNLLGALEEIEDEADRREAKRRLDELAGQRREAEDHRAALVERQAVWQDAEGRLARIEAWCRSEGARVDTMGFAERRRKLTELGVTAAVYPRGCEWRYLIHANVPDADDWMVSFGPSPVHTASKLLPSGSHT